MPQFLPAVKMVGGQQVKFLRHTDYFVYIAGVATVPYYKWAWVILVFVGATVPLGFVWNISDAFNGLMAIPNLIGLIALSPMIFAMLKAYKKK